MDKQKQIEEMLLDVVKAFNYARDFCTEQGGCDICKNRTHGSKCDFVSMAEHLYNNGYRKQSDTAKEIHGGREMFIKVKGEGNEDLLVNASQIKFIASSSDGNRSFIDFGSEIYIRSNTSITELEKVLMESEDTE